MAQNNQEKMYKLGLAMEEYRKFFWTGICLFFFIIPPFILLWKYIQFLIALNDVRQTSLQNENLKYGFFGLVIGLAMSLVTGSVGYTYYNMTFYVSVFQIVCLIFGWIKLEQWGEDLYRERNTHNMAQLKEGFKDIKIAQILSIILIGIFMMPGAFENAGSALIREFGPRRQATPQPQYGQTQQPQYSQTQQPPAQSPERLSICPQCGVSIPSNDIKFCGSCGNKF